MKTSWYAVIALVLASPGFAKEGGSVGNGGAAGVCFSSSAIVKQIKRRGDRISQSDLAYITSIQALDYYETLAQFPRPNPANLILSRAGETWRAYYARLMARLDGGVAPEVISNMEEILDQFKEKNFRYYTQAGIERIYDTGEKYYLDPEKCVIATLIRQSMVGDDLRLEIDQRLFAHPKHSLASRNILMVHELFYRLGIDRDHEDATQVRNFLAALLKRKVLRSEIIEAFAPFTPQKRYTDPDLYFLYIENRAMRHSISHQAKTAPEVFRRHPDFRSDVRDSNLSVVGFKKNLALIEECALPEVDLFHNGCLTFTSDSLRQAYLYKMGDIKKLEGSWPGQVRDAELARERELLSEFGRKISAQLQADSQAGRHFLDATLLPFTEAEFQKVAAKIAGLFGLPQKNRDQMLATLRCNIFDSNLSPTCSKWPFDDMDFVLAER